MATSSEGWQEDVLRRVAASRWERKTRYIGFQIRVGRHFWGRLNDAAKVRDVTISGYCRRALTVAIVHDLGLVHLRSLLDDCPTPIPYGSRQPVARGVPAPTDSGAGIEQWCPHPGCSGSHLSVQ